ncbi:MAG: biopolymer transporter ExbD [Bacteroidetes bacterium]|nr:biopolymer transporter ExbD [Bacteroidota bacterium]
MADLDTSSSGGGKHKGGKVRGKKLSTRIDMTPMVDLAFLLVTFFMLATSLSKPAAMPVTMPDTKEDPNVKPNVAAKSKVLTLILGKDDKIYYYRRSLEDNPEVGETTFGEANIRKVLLEKKTEITNDVVATLDRQDPIILVKPMRDSKYKNLVDIFDEFNITELRRFVMVPIDEKDITYLNSKGFLK